MPPRHASILFLVVLITVSSSVFAQQQETDSASVPPPFFLLDRAPDGPAWAPLLRLRDAEDTYRSSEEWWNSYTQIRAWGEATLGNHRAALRVWDGGTTPRDTVDTLPPDVKAVNALDVLAAVADTAQVIMINERHHAASDRLLTLYLLPILYQKGFRYLAAETFSARDSTLNARTYPIIGLTGIYTDEVVFAEVVREAQRLGYTLIPYEWTRSTYDVSSGMSREQFRDSSQAGHLYERIFHDDPDARVLVHAGYAHIEEKVRNDWKKMAIYLREMAGINPVTVDQTVLSERGTPEYEHPIYCEAFARGLLDQEPVVLVDADGHPYAPTDYFTDLQVLTPRSTYSKNRPEWMTLDGRRVAQDVPTPECADRLCFVEVRAVNEPEEAVPLDRAEVDRADLVRVYVPPTRKVELCLFAADGALLRKFVLDEE